MTSNVEGIKSNYFGMVLMRGYVIQDTDKDDPVTVQETMQRHDCLKWKEAISNEINSCRSCIVTRLTARRYLR